MGIHVCPTCGNEFEVHGQGPYKYCEMHRLTDAQRRAGAQRQLRKRRREARSPARCKICGKDFVAYRSDAKTCSDECRRVDLNQRARVSEQRHRGHCVDCGVEVARRSTRCKPCSQKLRIDAIRGDKNYAWKGGRTKDRYGYIRVLIAPEARKSHRYRAEHQLVWEAANGPIPEGHIIHHINGTKDDNRLENLEAMPRKKHNHRHAEHDKRIQELEAQLASLLAQLDGALHSQISS